LNKNGERMSDQYDLERFLEAQRKKYEQACAELRMGRKLSHWMWFIFPQIRGLGITSTNFQYAISGMAEARAYLEHPVLGSRIRECVDIVMEIEDKAIEEIFGYPDNLKFHSSMTLFAEVEDGIFRKALQRYFDGVGDWKTLEKI
jgi:uncharacterized protein (DUF1810 family)